LHVCESRSELRGEVVVVGEAAEYGMADEPAGGHRRRARDGDAG